MQLFVEVFLPVFYYLLKFASMNALLQDFRLSLKTSRSVIHDFITITNMVSWKAELNKLFKIPIIIKKM